MTTRQTPTFLLKGLDPNKLLADYQAGFFSRKPVAKAKIQIAQNKTILAPTYGTTNKDAVFSIKDRNNCSVVIAKTGHADCEVYNSTGGDLSVGGRCDKCKKDFDTIAMGYPIAYQELTILTNAEENIENARYRILYIFWVEGKFCSFECALAYIQLLLSLPADHRDTTIRDSERMLKTLYKLTYPNAPVLRPSQDTKLLRSNGGSLTNEEWQDNQHIYVRTERVLMIPAQVEYIKQKFNDQSTNIDINGNMVM